VLGLDVYWSHLGGVFAWGKPEAMGRVSAEVGKPWWLVETAGADGPWLRRPSCRTIGRHSERCAEAGAEVLGYYALWGDRGGLFDYHRSYKVFTDPGPDPSRRTDRRGEAYWECIRDL
jgi:hypothetical protein